MTIVHSDNAPAAIGPYSQAISSGNFLYLSGQIGLNPETGKLAGETAPEQAEQAIKNIKAVLAAEGLSLSDVVKTTCFLTDMADFAAFNAVYGQHFTGKPARSCVAVSALPAGALCEIEAIAEK